MNEEVLSLKLLERFLPESTYLPYSSSSLSFESIRIISNDVVIHNRHKVLEFGAGISTIVLGKLLQSTGSEARLISIDESREWVEFMNEILEKENISSVSIIHVPTVPSSEEGDRHWYDRAILKERLNQPSNLIIVDGPSAWQKDRNFARRPALDFLLANSLLVENDFAVYLDDCNRKGEKEILKQWSSRLDGMKSTLYNSLGRVSKNDKFNVI